MKAKDARKSTAIHEAGHAVAADELAVHFDTVSIIPGEGRLGSIGVEGDDCYFILPGTDPHSPENERGFRAWAERQAIIDYAGHAAVVVLLGQGDTSYRSAVKCGAGDDYDKASRRLGRNQRRIEAARASALKIVSKRRNDIRNIAKALIERSSLDEQLVDFVIECGKIPKWADQARTAQR